MHEKNLRRALLRALAFAMVTSTAFFGCSAGSPNTGNGGGDDGGTGNQKSNETGNSSSSGGKSSSGGTSSSGSSGSGNGAACTKAEDCPSLPCPCSNGSTTGYRGCTNGRCETACPSNAHAAGQSCVVPGGCFCASGACEFSTQTCCANHGSLASGAPCGSDCDCASGTCSFSKCF